MRSGAPAERSILEGARDPLQARLAGWQNGKIETESPSARPAPTPLELRLFNAA